MPESRCCDWLLHVNVQVVEGMEKSGGGGRGGSEEDENRGGKIYTQLTGSKCIPAYL